jgi:hypothetical protein
MQAAIFMKVPFPPSITKAKQPLPHKISATFGGEYS